MTEQVDSSLLEKVVFHSSAMQGIQKELDSSFIHSAKPLFFWGESGSGSAFYARAIHQASRRGEFLRFSLIALNEEEVKTDFFGIDGQAGWLQKADKGTIFIREICESSLPVQRFLMHLLKLQSVNGGLEYPRVGSAELVKVNVRFIFSMSHTLSEAIQDGLLLPELEEFLSKKGKIIRHPSLRERKEDIVEIAENFFESFNEQYGQHVSEFDEEAKHALVNYSWFGNIDELKETIGNIFAQKLESDTIVAEHLPSYIISPEIAGEGDLYSFKLKDGERVKGRFRTSTLHFQKSNRKKFRLSVNGLVELTRVVNKEFTPPRFQHYLIKFKDGDQLIAENILDENISIETSFASSYAINLRNIDSILRL